MKKIFLVIAALTLGLLAMPVQAAQEKKRKIEETEIPSAKKQKLPDLNEDDELHFERWYRSTGVTRQQYKAGKELLDAITKLDVDRVINALDQGANPNGLDNVSFGRLTTSFLGHNPDEILANRMSIKDSMLAILNALVNHGLNPNFIRRPYDNAETILFDALDRLSQPFLAEALIDLGADVNKRSAEGVTPLMKAAKNGNAAAIEILLRKGADLAAIDTKNRNAISYINDYQAPFIDSEFIKESMMAVVENYLKQTGKNAHVNVKTQTESKTSTEAKVKAEITPYTILGIPKDASDEQILGITKEELKNKKTVKKAYRALARIWHPDKIYINDIAKTRYEQSDVSKLSKDEKIALANEVFKIIDAAYKRHQ